MKIQNTVPKGQSLIKLSVKHMAGCTLLIYRLYEAAMMDGGREIAVFSLSVTKIGCTGIKEHVYFKDISRTKSEAIYLFKAFSRGLVTPMVAEEILSDLVGTDITFN